ncbi:MAG TPA: hypothetical protein VN380_08410 [Thermoanaerobaculia bacterium]|jgi:hypothetical protein|nr:hypothetical protein [Thermoanaerobaculia bacterium]
MSKATLEPPTAEASIAPAARTIPSVEIFANQLPILIRQGKTKTITLTGAVYDQPFTGNITLQPTPNFQSGCPLFANIPFNGVYTNIQIPVGPNSVQLPFSVTGPTNLKPGDYICKLTYDAEYAAIGGPIPVGKGNTVSIKYTLKKPALPGEPD